MLLELLSLLGSALEERFTQHLILLTLTAYFLRYWSNGAKTDRDRNLHGRVVLLTVR